ncbi:MAG TPA: FecR domain-containing protein [Polyangiaceae bacterium]|jgi:hypothetical protein|nr:FecR domain-containing protein [Polyangiaceae bacterium]
MSDEAKVRELFAPAQSRPVDVEGRRFKVNRDRVISAILHAPGQKEAYAAPTRWRTLAAMAAGFVALVGSAGWFVLHRQTRTLAIDDALSVTRVRGTVTSTERGVGRSLAPGQVVAISPDGEFTTAPESEASLRSANGLEIEIFEKTQMALAGLKAASTSSVNLAKGYIRCRVPHLGEGHTFSVITPDATVMVHGTVFRVTVSSRDGAPETCVRVDEGVVSVQTAAGETFVGANRSWGCDHEEQLSAPPSSPTAKPVSSPASRWVKGRQAEPAKTPVGTLDEEIRLFQAGLSAERQGDARGAGTFFEELLAHYPNSPLAGDARRALVRVKRDSEREP